MLAHILIISSFYMILMTYLAFLKIKHVQNKIFTALINHNTYVYMYM